MNWFVLIYSKGMGNILNYVSQFESFLSKDAYENLHKKQKKERILSLIHDYITNSGNLGLFQNIVKCRQNHILKTSHCDYSGDLRRIFSPNNTNIDNCLLSIGEFSEEERLIEMLAKIFFTNILVCWAEYERFKIFIRYPLERRPALDVSCIRTSREGESEQCSELVDEISKDPRLFLTQHHETPMYLDDAVALINLEVFVLEQHWYEMLFSLELSTKGRHFILYHYTGESAFPSLTATALIQGWNSLQTWLSFDPFFHNDQWHLCLPEHAVSTLQKTEVLTEQFQIDVKSVESFESSLKNQVSSPESICEILRLTVSGKKESRHFNLYLAQKKLVQLLVDHDIRLALTIIDSPVMLDFYQSLDTHSYMHSCFRDINGTGKITYKGFWITHALNKQFIKHNFRSYNVNIIKRRNKMKSLLIEKESALA